MLCCSSIFLLIFKIVSNDYKGLCLKYYTSPFCISFVKHKIGYKHVSLQKCKISYRVQNA